MGIVTGHCYWAVKVKSTAVFTHTVGYVYGLSTADYHRPSTHILLAYSMIFFNLP